MTVALQLRAWDAQERIVGLRPQRDERDVGELGRRIAIEPRGGIVRPQDTQELALDDQDGLRRSLEHRSIGRGGYGGVVSRHVPQHR
ncbi:MAG TPA: hypothetical protein VFA72_07390 [Burkholderiales bacterium]|nr:hypothetical protein [Burkholderiales bacterium]